MKKAFEFFLTLIIFYGVYAVFDDALPYVFPELQLFWIIIISLLVAAALLLLYAQIIASSTKLRVTEKMKRVVVDLESRVQSKEDRVEQKDSELINTFRIKKTVKKDAENIL